MILLLRECIGRLGIYPDARTIAGLALAACRSCRSCGHSRDGTRSSRRQRSLNPLTKRRRPRSRERLRCLHQNGRWDAHDNGDPPSKSAAMSSNAPAMVTARCGDRRWFEQERKPAHQCRINQRQIGRSDTSRHSRLPTTAICSSCDHFARRRSCLRRWRRQDAGSATGDLCATACPFTKASTSWRAEHPISRSGNGVIHDCRTSARRKQRNSAR